MKHIAIVVLCIMFAITTTSALLSQNDVKTHFDKFFVDKELTKAGATGVMVVVTEGQNLVWQGSYGQKKMTFDSSLIPIADLSATITASTVMQLVQDNKIDLQKDVNEYLKKDAELATLVTDFIIGNYSNYGNSPVFPTTEKITTHNLLTQTAGLDARQIGLLANTFETIMDPLTAIKTVFPPRIRKANEICQFSHHGITLAGVIAQLVSGTKLDKLVQDKIFTPLKMESSSPFLTDKIVANANFAKPSKTVAGTLVETFATPFNNYWPSNGIVSTAKDMSWFMRANLNNGTANNGTIFNAATASMMQSRQFTPKAPQDGIGYPWVENHRNQLQFFSHDGDLDPYHSQMNLIPEKGIGVFFYATSDILVQSLFDRALGAFIDDLILKTNCSGKVVDNVCMNVIKEIKAPASTKDKEDFLSRARQCEGCFRTTRSEHTTWFKIQQMIDPVICVQLFDPTDPYLTVVNTDLILIEKEKFIWQFVTVGADGFTWEANNQSRVTFLNATNAKVARYMNWEGTHVYERLPAQEAGMFTFVVMLIFWVSAWILFCIKVFRHHLGLGMSPDAKKIEKSILFSISPNAAEENARPSTAKFINRKIGLWCEILFIIFSFISYIGVLIEWGETNPTKLYPQGGGIVFVLLFPIFNTIILPLLTAQIYFLYQENWYVLPADAKFNSFYKWWYIIVVCFAWMSMFFQIGWNIYSPGSTTI